MHDVDNDEDGSARDCDKVTMRMMAMMMDDDDDDEVEDGRGDEMQVNSCASSVTITRRIMRMVLNKIPSIPGTKLLQRTMLKATCHLGELYPIIQISLGQAESCSPSG